MPAIERRIGNGVHYGAARSDAMLETRSEVVGADGAPALEAIDVLDRATGAVHRRPCSVLFVMIGADAATGWLPDEIARDERGFIVTGPDAAATPTGSSSAGPSPSRRARPASSRPATCALAR